jgi:hypothetical protein
MRTLGDAQRQRARELIEQLRDPWLHDEASGVLLDELVTILLDPRVSDLLFWRSPELAADDVIDEALRYMPFIG